MLLAFSATFVALLPVAAEDPNLSETSNVTYTVDPQTGDIEVDMVFTIKNDGNSPVNVDRWGPIYVEEGVNPQVIGGPFETLRRFGDLPGMWRELYVRGPRIPGGERERLIIKYRIPAAIARNASNPASTSDPALISLAENRIRIVDVAATSVPTSIESVRH
jgi:hypothetical protein